MALRGLDAVAPNNANSGDEVDNATSAMDKQAAGSLFDDDVCSVAGDMAADRADRADRADAIDAADPADAVWYYTKFPVRHLRIDAHSGLGKTKRGVYEARLVPGVIVQTPVMVLRHIAADRCDLACDAAFTKFVKAVERRVIDEAVRHKDRLFGQPLEPAALRAAYKSFVAINDDVGFIVGASIDENTQFFDEHGAVAPAASFQAGTAVRCILEATRVYFGSAEYGIMFRVAQVQRAQVPTCKIVREREVSARSSVLRAFE